MKKSEPIESLGNNYAFAYLKPNRQLVKYLHMFINQEIQHTQPSDAHPLAFIVPSFRWSLARRRISEWFARQCLFHRGISCGKAHSRC